ncbi:MAG: MBL fold metallo-hydrolase [Verrucomicrobiota bacterium]
MLLDIQFTRAGIHLPQLGLWLDAHRRIRGNERVFVSHAHADHIAAHDDVLLTEATSLFMRTRLPGRRREQHLVFGQRTEHKFGGEIFTLTALPAGHILGSAMAFIEWREETLLYTGDFKLRPSLAAEKPEVRCADWLIMETTFGLPRYQFPPEEKVRADMVKFCSETLADGATPVLYGYSLGKSQEILRSLAGVGLPVMLQRDVRKMTKLYEKLGMTFPPHEVFEPEAARGKVIIAPPNSLKTLQKLALDPMRSAAITGWAMDSSCRYRSGTDAAFPLSDHADYDGLLELVKLVQPKKVFTIHGFTREFAQTLRAQGVDAVAPGCHEQLRLTL